MCLNYYFLKFFKTLISSQKQNLLFFLDRKGNHFIYCHFNKKALWLKVLFVSCVMNNPFCLMREQYMSFMSLTSSLF